jgi:hypothetical protein
VQPDSLYQVYAAIGGILDCNLGKEGDLVQKGTPLLQIINNAQDRKCEVVVTSWIMLAILILEVSRFSMIFIILPPEMVSLSRIPAALFPKLIGLTIWIDAESDFCGSFGSNIIKNGYVYTLQTLDAYICSTDCLARHSICEKLSSCQ